jgi:hypothetical protein
MNHYNTRFSSRALAIFYELQGFGLVDAEERFLVQHPTNPNGIEHVAQVLGTIGHAS